MPEVPLAAVAGIVACLVASAFFSGSETALTSLDRARTRRLIDTGGRRNRALELWLDRPTEILTTILFFNNLVNITASALATEVAHAMLAPTTEGAFLSPVAVAIGVMTFLLLTFGEILPKTLARAHASLWAGPAMIVLSLAYRLTRPVNWAFVVASRMIGAERDEGAPFVTEEDLGYLFELGGEEGSIPGDQAEILQSVFELDDTLVRDVMVPVEDVFAVTSDISIDALAGAFIAAGHSRLPVFGEDANEVVGVAYAKDLLRYLVGIHDATSFELATVMRRAERVPADQPIDVLLREMKDKRVHMAIVVDGEGAVIGVVTLEDIIEVLIGDVFDEYDDEEAAEYHASQREFDTPEDPPETTSADHDDRDSDDGDSDDGPYRVAIEPPAVAVRAATMIRPAQHRPTSEQSPTEA